jgi:hypothetical protein
MEVLYICEDFVLMITALELPIKKTDNVTKWALRSYSRARKPNGIAH